MRTLQAFFFFFLQFMNDDTFATLKDSQRPFNDRKLQHDIHISILYFEQMYDVGVMELCLAIGPHCSSCLAIKSAPSTQPSSLK